MSAPLNDTFVIAGVHSSLGYHPLFPLHAVCLTLLWLTCWLLEVAVNATGSGHRRTTNHISTPPVSVRHRLLTSSYRNFGGEIQESWPRDPLPRRSEKLLLSYDLFTELT